MSPDIQRCQDGIIPDQLASNAPSSEFFTTGTFIKSYWIGKGNDLSFADPNRIISRIMNNRISRVTWERNGNFHGCDDDGGGSHVMDKPLSQKFSYNADLNSNEILIPDLQSEQQLNKNTTPITNKSEKIFTLDSPTSAFATSLHQKDLSYDDLSKNIDANLAEIDMETFRSEDINSILALPAIYSGHFDSVNHGEQCASVSGSLLNGLEIETSVSNRVSEDEISICKDEPLFSPQREPPTHERTISVDGLDNSSSYDQDLVLTCKANKNNYTIVFEGSETQFSEDSEGHQGLRSSQVVSSASEDVNNENSYTSSSMIQSDLVLTTWSNLKRTHIGKKPRRCLYDISLKSRSLPNLSYQAAFLNDKALHWAKTRGNKTSHSPDLDAFPPSNLQMIRKCGYPYALSLVKLFMKYKVSSRSSVFSSEHSSSANSSVTHSLNNINHSSTSKTEQKDYKESDADLANRNYNIKNQIGLENLNTQQKRQIYVDNIKVLDWHPSQNVNESNNNTSSLKTGSKLHISKDSTSPSGECDNSLCFEDSLMEAPILQVKNFNASPIKEEEETDISSGDEIMKTSMSSDCNNCSSASIDAAIIKNNALDIASNASRQDVDHLNLERIINIFPSCKVNGETSTDSRDNQTQATQTKHFNGKNIDNMCTDSPKVKQITMERCIRHTTGSRDGSPSSSGYVSSRHSSAERMQRSSVGSADAVVTTSVNTNLKNVLLTTTRNCSTQVPVHVKDCCMQTSTFLASQTNAGFLITNSLKGEEVSQIKCNSESNSIVGHAENCTLNKPVTNKDKCIYVCFPNYSLPDLSFLKSFASDNSTSVFLSPTKLKPCTKLLQTSFSKPKSTEELDSKRLSNIKDWESLSVLLPDDMKHLLTEMKMKDAKPADASSEPQETDVKSKTDLPGNCDSEKKKPPANALRQCSFNLRNRNVPYFETVQSPIASWKGFHPDGVRAKYTHCICQQCQAISAALMQSKETLKASISDECFGKSGYKLPPECSDFKSRNFSTSSQPERSHSCSRYTMQKPLYLAEDMKHTTSRHPVPTMHSASKNSDVSNINPKHAAFKISHKCMTPSTNNGNIIKLVKNNPCYDELNVEQKNLSGGLDHPHSNRLKKCDHVDSEDFFDMEKAPQEFLVSPVQNASPYPMSTDSYQMKNSSNNGNTSFHESLKRKTGLVENLQKATVLILEDHTEAYKHDIAHCMSFSVGQKILTFLCPAVHTILSDGLLPSVQGFFGLLPNSPWKVTEASVQLEESKKEVQELLKHVNSEKLLTDSTYRFNAFIMGLLNLGSLEWWLGHLMSSSSLIIHHYHPTALLSLLSLPASSHLKQELTELVSPLTTMSFNLDLAFETRLAVTKANEKCSSTYGSSNKNELIGEAKQNKLKDFNYCNPHKCGKPESKDVQQCQENPEDLPVWPGVTINPFPNAQLFKDANSLNLSPRKIIHHKQDPLKYDCIQKVYPGAKERASRKHITDMSLCSSTDSGCSSQVCQSHNISSVATDSGESESQTLVKQDGQQFRKLQQKWEKITHGLEQPKSPKSSTPSLQNPKKSPSEVHVKKTSRCQVRVTSNDDSVKNSKTTKRAVSQPPCNKQHSRPEAITNRKLQTPDVIASAKATSEKKNLSHIPTLKATKNLQPRSKIPIQKSGLRTQSANRDVRNLQ